jgi:hypothetical protein
MLHSIYHMSQEQIMFTFTNNNISTYLLIEQIFFLVTLLSLFYELFRRKIYRIASFFLYIHFVSFVSEKKVILTFILKSSLILFVLTTVVIFTLIYICVQSISFGDYIQQMVIRFM